MKGIILAGGSGSRLSPITDVISKQLLPVFDKPMIHYPLATLMHAGVREILIICTPQDLHLFQMLFKNSSLLGIDIKFETQSAPNGIPEAFIIGEDFIGTSDVCLILGDNIFFGSGLGNQLSNHRHVAGARIFGHHVKDPERYGVVKFNSDGSIHSLVEKPNSPESNIAVTGLYFYDNSVVEKTKKLEKSRRGELEITDLNLMYLRDGMLNLEILPRGTAWLDTGTFNSLHDASTFVRVLEERQGMKIACLEEIAWRNNWVSNSQLQEIALGHRNPEIKKYLIELVN